MVFLLNLSGQLAAASMPGLAPGAPAKIGFDAGQARVGPENTGVGAAGDPAMQSSTSGTTGA